MTGLKFLFRRSCSLVRMWIPALIGITLLVLALVFHEPMSSEDYLLCKMMAHTGMIFVMIFSSIFISVEINGNRLMRSAPISKQLRTFSVPMYNVVVGVGLSALVNIIYAIFVMIMGLDLCHISDMLIVSAVICVSYVILGTISMQFNWGMLVMIYAYIPMMLLLPIIPDHIWESGFGASVGVGLVVYIAAAVISAVLAFVISHIFYKKYDFKPFQQTMQGM